MAYPERCLDAVYAVTPMVLLVLEGADAEAGTPAVGVVLNAPTKLKLRAHDWMHAVEMPTGGVFEHSPVHYGGGDALRTLTMVHPHGEKMPGSRKLTSKLYEGGYLCDAAQLVRAGHADVDDFLFFRGKYEWKWSTGELEEQLRSGELIRPPSEQPVAEAAEAWARVRPDALATDEGRLAVAWRTWATHIRRCDPALSPLLRLDKAELKQVIVRAAHSVRSVGRRGSRGPIVEADAELTENL